MHRRPSLVRGTEYAATNVPFAMRSTDGAHVPAQARPSRPRRTCAQVAGVGSASLLPDGPSCRAVHVRRSVEVIVGRFSAATVVDAA
jgi:hypothetical protein